MYDNPNSLVVRIFGMHHVQFANSKKAIFLVQENFVAPPGMTAEARTSRPLSSLSLSL
jgi:hypothetical protein